jgi:hypothetical protein
MLPPTSLYYMTRDEAHQWLKETTGMDFGFDGFKWEEWGVQHGEFMSSWQGLRSMGYKPDCDDESENC